MNTLDLPPRRPLPRETRDRIRRTVDTGTAGPPKRSRAPLAAAAAVVLGAMAAFIGASVSRDDPQEAAPPGADFSTPTMALAGGHTEVDLDRCAEVATASPRAADFAPRGEWRPKFTVALQGGTRVTAFLGGGGKPSFCEVGLSSATVSDPTAGWVPLASTTDTPSPAFVSAVSLSPSGVLTGIAEGVTALEFQIVQGPKHVPVGVPTFRQSLFVVDLGTFGSGDSVMVIGRNSQGMVVVTGVLPLDRTNLPAAGVTG